MLKAFTLLIVLFSTNLIAQIIPDSLRVNWNKAGLKGAVPEYATAADVTSFGAIPNDTIDDYPAVAAAITSLNINAGVIYFPPGTYVIHSSINLPDSVIIRGAGADSTTLTFNFNSVTANCINIIGGTTGNFVTITSGYLKGSRRLIIPNASTLFSAGNQVEIREANGAWDTNPASWATYSVGHLSAVDSVDGDTLWMNETLRMNFDSALTPQIRKIIPRTMCGLECFKMTRTDSLATSVNYGVYFNFADNCWMRGVESYKNIGAHVVGETASHLYISGCYFHESYVYDGVSTNGYGVLLITHSCSNLIENNIFRKLRHCMIAKQGANGNVFGYNYSIQPNRSEVPADYGADLLLHGHFAFANLFEGNISQNLDIDQTWGPSGPFNTFFRNKLELYGVIMTSGTVQSDRQNFVGNDVSNMVFPYGQYILYGANNFTYGNDIKGVIMPAGTTSLLDTSYYLDTIPPAFWNIPQSLPSIGEPNSFSADNNPARARNLSGGSLALCGFHQDSIILNNRNLDSPPSLQIKNASIQESTITLLIQSDREYNNAMMEIYSVTGRRIFFGPQNIKAGKFTYSLRAKEKFSDGIYALRLSTPSFQLGSKKIIVVNGH